MALKRTGNNMPPRLMRLRLEDGVRRGSIAKYAEGRGVGEINRRTHFLVFTIKKTKR